VSASSIESRLSCSSRTVAVCGPLEAATWLSRARYVLFGRPGSPVWRCSPVGRGRL